MGTDYYSVFAILSAVSSIGCLLIISIYYKYSNLQLFAYSLVKDLVIFDLFYSLVWLIPSSATVPCNIQGVLMSGASLQTVLWTAVISNTLLQRVVLRKEIDENSYERKSLIVVITVSWVLALVPYTALVWDENPYGDSGGWCWVRQNQDTHLGWVWRLTTFYVPFVLVVIFNTIVNSIVIKRIYESGSSGRKRMATRLAMYSVVLFLCFVPAAVLRLYYYLDDYENPDALILAAGVLSCLIGFLDSIVYGFTRSVREQLSLSIRGAEVNLLEPEN